jgi:hypothetical protein
MLILPVIETESKMFENPFHLHFLTGVLFLKYRKYCDQTIFASVKRSRGFDRDRIRGVRGSRIQVKKVQKSRRQKSEAQKGAEDSRSQGVEWNAPDTED